MMSAILGPISLDVLLLESVAACLDEESVQALGNLELDEPTKARLSELAERVNEGKLTVEESREYAWAFHLWSL